MEMNSGEISISDVLINDKQFQIPRYQRRYVWNETNWHTLSTDILALLGLELEGNKADGFTFNPTEKVKKHFTGIIVTDIDESGEVKIFEVIDGQQRLTTFLIIFSVIRDIFKLKKPFEPAHHFEKFIENEPNTVKRLGEDIKV